jgi:hypothetical protein
MRYKRKKRNAPIATLIKNYINKKSGKVSESREEIKWRFNWLDWKDQKRILTAFLDSGRSDREWAYGKVFDYLDESFLQKNQRVMGNIPREQMLLVCHSLFPDRLHFRAYGRLHRRT